MYFLYFILFSSINLLNHRTYAWDLAVALKGRVELLENEQVVRTLAVPHVTYPRGLALDSKRGLIFLTSALPTNGTAVFALPLAAEENVQPFPVIAARNEPNEFIQNVAYDPMENKMYWSDNQAFAIYHAKLPARLAPGVEPAQGVVLHQFTEEHIPQGLVLDHCRRWLFWTNVNPDKPSIERSNLDGSARKELVLEGLRQPLGLTLDLHDEGYLYWGSRLDGVFFNLERCRLDGSGRELLYHNSHHRPFSLALLPPLLLWSDLSNDLLWSIDLSGTLSERQEREVVSYRHTPYGLLAFHNDSMDVCHLRDSTPAPTITSAALSLPVTCRSGGTLLANNTCVCPPGFSGGLCELDSCVSWCMGGGQCVPGDPPTCVCPEGRLGARCEIDPCRGYCLNGGVCELNGTGGAAPRCRCDVTRYSGERCEVRRDVCGAAGCDCRDGGLQQCDCESVLSNSSFAASVALTNISSSSDLFIIGSPINMLVIGLGSTCGLLLVVIGVLTWRVVRLSRRPRIKRRVVVNRRGILSRGGTPAADRPDTCEITIENCCNMNICETPCFEPPVRTPGKKNKREEKKTLLANMEDPTDSPDGCTR